MKNFGLLMATPVLSFAGLVTALAQDSGQTQPAPIAASETVGTTVPRLINFSGEQPEITGE